MSYIFLQEQGEESSAECFSDIEPFVRSRLNLTAEKSSCSDSETASCLGSRSGTMCEPSTEIRGAVLQTLCAEGSPVRTSAQVGKVQGLTERKVGCGQKCEGSLARYDHDTHSLKTHQCLLFEDSTECCVILPRWGMVCDGELLELPTPVGLTDENEFGYWPTPTGVKGAGHCVGALSEWGGASNIFRGTELRNVHCPRFEEWMMGWPDQWTALTPYETDKFQLWQRQHGRF